MAQPDLIPSNKIAFKEWAVVCEALHRGRQSLILRKGGIHEGRAGFRVEHDQFWLFPTEFHQAAEVLAADAADLLEEVRCMEHPEQEVLLRNYVVIEEVVELPDLDRVKRLAGWHVWSEQTVAQRFQYRTPGLFALLVRTFQQEPQIRIPDLASYGGCRSWVDFDNAISTEALRPVLSDAEHAARMEQLRRAIASEAGL